MNVHALLSHLTSGGIGAAIALLSVGVAHRFGLIQITLMQKAHALNVSKATPRVGCDVRILQKQILGPGFNPHLMIVVELYNEGELPVHDVQGEWVVLGPSALRTAHPFQRDFLGKCDKFCSEYMIAESSNWLKTVTFDIIVDFYYMTPGQPEEREHFEATYRYENGVAKRIAITKPIVR
jgi:hypothetical protein